MADSLTQRIAERYAVRRDGPFRNRVEFGPAPSPFSPRALGDLWLNTETGALSRWEFGWREVATGDEARRLVAQFLNGAPERVPSKED